MSEPSEIEKKNLEAHVELCAQRYGALEEKLCSIDKKVETLDKKIEEVKECVQKMDDKQYERIINWAGVIISILLAVIAWLISELIPKAS